MTMVNGYEQSDREKHIKVVDLESLEAEAQKIIPTGAFGYISGGSEDEWTLRQNRKSFTHKQIYPRVLTDVEKPEISTNFMGIDLKTPIMMPPLAAQGLANSQSEKDTARAFAAAGGLMALSTYGSATIADFAKAGNGAPQFFQLYMSKNDDFNKSLLDEAKRNGMKAIILTADSTLGGYREADVINNFQFPIPMANLEKLSQGAGKGQGIAAIYAAAAQKIGPDEIKKIADYTDLPVIVKGIQNPVDAELAIDAGAAAIYVSNHGGRQLNGGPGSFDVLPEIAAAVAKRVPIIFDSGIRHGSDVFKALATGADLVAIGRPFVYALALGGQLGVEDALAEINREFQIVMQLAGTQTIEDVKNTKLADLS